MECEFRDRHHALRRSIWMLLSLALLAERAGSRCFPVRVFVLSLLARAEVAAHGYIVDAMPSAGPWLEAPITVWGRPGEPSSLALRFRALAAAFGALLRCDCLSECCRIDAPPERLARSRAPATTASRPVPFSADTS